MVALLNMVARWHTRTGGKYGHLLAKAWFSGGMSAHIARFLRKTSFFPQRKKTQCFGQNRSFERGDGIAAVGSEDGAHQADRALDRGDGLDPS